MASIKASHTRPELIFKKLSDGRILRYHPAIPGRPDFGNKYRKIAIFVDGCFWHGCPLCYREPTSNVGYWRAKIARNRANDDKVAKGLKNAGYTVMRFWEHDILNNALDCVLRSLEAAMRWKR